MISIFGIIVIMAVSIIEMIVNYCVLQETNAKYMKISHSSLFLAIRLIIFKRINLQRGNVFILLVVIYIAIEIIVIMSSIIEILEILLSHSPNVDTYELAMPAMYLTIGIEAEEKAVTVKHYFVAASTHRLPKAFNP